MNRHAIKWSAVALALFVNLGSSQAAEYRSNWRDDINRVWIGPEFWANRLHDWRLHDGRVECLADQPRLKLRALHLLTQTIADRKGEFTIKLRIGLMNEPGENVAADSGAGVWIGVGDKSMDWRSAALIHGGTGNGVGRFVGVKGDGDVTVQLGGDPNGQRGGTSKLTPPVDLHKGIELTIKGGTGTSKKYRLEWIRSFSKGDAQVKQNSTVEFDDVTLFGGIALVAHPGSAGQAGKPARWWFDDFEVSGDVVEAHPERTLGPIVSTQYTVSRGVMKMTAQFMPIGEKQPHTAALQVQKADGSWKTVDEAEIIVPGWTATFRDDKWDASIEDKYRVLYPSPSSDASPSTLHPKPSTWPGTIRKDPVDRETIVVAGFTGNHNNAHGFSRPNYNFVQNIWFPHAEIVEHVSVHQPDLLFFSGDQVYEGDSPTFADSNPANIKLDYLYKWYLWCWAYRDLTKDIPSICIPDDHDVYQGNIWGQGGRKSPGRDHHGGYVHPADFVQMVERTQTSHLPDPYLKEPLEQGIHAYFTDLVWGSVGVAVLEDRKFKSGCARDDMPPSGTGRPDHFNDPDFDVAKLDIPGVQLLGEKQLEFIDRFAQDWKGQQMKMAVSQTIFANMATHHGGSLQRLIADLDSNGWPQSGRNRAVDALRKGFVFHLGGDQHLATIVHHGIEEHGDAIWSFCVPSVANFYPRAWAPHLKGAYSYPEPADYTGKHYDGFKHPVVVYAATNPGRDMGHEPRNLHNNMPGYGIVKLNKAERSITMECWPRFADPRTDKQYLGWPKTIAQTDNYARKAAGYLPTINVSGMDDPVVQVIHEKNGDVVYTLRITGRSFRPKVFEEGGYTVVVGEPGDNRTKRFESLNAASENDNRSVDVAF